jgi:hypothetical protein
MSSESRPIDVRASISLVCLALVVSAVAIDPLRETAFTDDWVYATMVRHLLETGKYHVHPWAAANPWFLIVWGAIFSKLFGYSFTTLRLSALTLTSIGSISFFHLCREHRLGAREAALLTLVFSASPLILRHAFSFMTDVPFIALCSWALLLYTRGLRRQSGAYVVCGSIVASAAILVRQFGTAFIPALVLVWLASSSRLRRLPLLLAGALLPLAATVWQIDQGIQESAWTARLRFADQLAFIRSPTFALDLFWRALVVPIHLVLYGLPLVLVAIFLLLSARRRRTNAPKSARVVETGLGYVALTIVGLWAGAKLLGRPVFMPLIDWNLAALASWPRPLSALLTACLIVLGAWLCSTIVRRYRDPTRRPSSPAEALFDAFTLCLLAEQLVYVQFSDRYLLPFLPFALIVIGRELWLDHGISAVELRAGISAALAMLIVSTAWERGTLSRGEALWRGGDWLMARGIDAELVHSESWEWEYYQGSFDRWLGAQLDPGTADFNDFFDRFWPAAWRNARYVVAVRPPSPDSSGSDRVLWSVPYRDELLRRRFVDVVDRGPETIGATSSAVGGPTATRRGSGRQGQGG